MLLDGEGDAIAGDEMLIQYYSNSMGIKNQISILKDELYAKKVSIAVNDGQDMLLEVLNKGILQLKKDNVLHNLQISWFGSSNSSFKDVRENLWIPVFFAAFFGFSILLYIWDSILRKQIKLATIEINNQKKELRTIIDTIDSCLVVINEKEIIVEANMETEQFTGLSYNELLDSDINDVHILGDIYIQYKANGEKVLDFSHMKILFVEVENEDIIPDFRYEEFNNKSQKKNNKYEISYKKNLEYMYSEERFGENILVCELTGDLKEMTAKAVDGNKALAVKIENILKASGKDKGRELYKVRNELH